MSRGLGDVYKRQAQQQSAHGQQGQTGRQRNGGPVGPGAKARHRTAKSNSCKKENGGYAGQPPAQRRHIGKIRRISDNEIIVDFQAFADAVPTA